MKIYRPSCSEMTFKLTGSVDKIKSEVLKMLTIVEKDYGKSDDKEWRKESKKVIAEKKKEVTAVKKLEDFENIVFPFTCNWLTAFMEQNNELIVATCNNHEWSGENEDCEGVEYEEVDEKLGEDIRDKVLYTHELKLIHNNYAIILDRRAKKYLFLGPLNQADIDEFNSDAKRGSDAYKIVLDKAGYRIIDHFSINNHVYSTFKEVTDKKTIDELKSAILISKL
jgi:hypothetical protein